MRSDMSIPTHGGIVGASGWPLRPTLFAASAIAGILAALCVGVKHHRAAPVIIVCHRVSAATMDPEDAIVAYCRAGQPAKALEIADARLTALNDPADPESPPVLRKLETGRIYFLRGGVLRLLYRETEAQADYAKAEKLAGDSIPGEERADLLAQSGNAAAACKSAEATIQNDPDDPDVVNNACWELALCPGGDAARAARLMAPIARDSTDSYHLDTYAWSLYRSGDVGAAIAEEQIAVQAAQPDDSPMFYAACLTGMQGDRLEAIQELRQIFQQNIRQPDAWAAAQAFAGQK